jgi:hypothetical protein
VFASQVFQAEDLGRKYDFLFFIKLFVGKNTLPQNEKRTRRVFGDGHTLIIWPTPPHSKHFAKIFLEPCPGAEMLYKLTGLA